MNVPPAICLHNIHLDYHNVPLFADLNFNISAGKWTAILGQSGIGKTTLLRIIAGLTKAAGEVSGENHESLHQKIAYMGQTDLLLPWLTALDNALLSGKLHHQITHALKKQAIELFAKVGLSTAIKKFPHELSGGMRQRVALIRTLLQKKPVVLMDEPFSGLDAITRFQLQAVARNLLYQHTVLMVTHDPIEALRLADDIYILAGNPVTPTLVASLSSSTPRPLDHPDVIYYQGKLIQQLSEARQ